MNTNIMPRNTAKTVSNKDSNSTLSIIRIGKISANAFIKGAKQELTNIETFILKKEATSLLKSFAEVDNIDDAKKIASKLLDILSTNNSKYSNDCSIHSLFKNAPVFKILFTESDKFDNALGGILKKNIYDINSREQVILYSMMEASYFCSYKNTKNVIDHINNYLNNFNFSLLNESDTFDNIAICCIKLEEKINKDNNINLNVGGMRQLALLL